jgi:hypothetical protein
VRFLDLMESDTNTKNKQQSNSPASPLMNMLHHFGEFVANIDDAKPDSDMCIDALANKKEPEELLQLTLDIVRCMFEPHPVGTWLLNGNPDFLDEAINNKDSSNICYSSSSLSTTNNFNDHITNTIVPSLEYQGYQPSNSQTIYVIITTHGSNLNTETIESTSSAITDTLNINGDTTIHIGYCRDDALADTVRVSVMVLLG